MTSKIPFLLTALLFSALSPARGQVSGGSGNPPTPQEAPGEIRGRIFGRHGSVVGFLPYAMVSVSAGTVHRTVATDSLGTYLVDGLPPGTWQVRVLHVGYEDITANARVPSGGRVDLDMELIWRPVALPPLMILADPVDRSSAPESAAARDLGQVALMALEASPGMVEAGLAEVVRSLPGHDPADPTDVLLLRGSASDLKLVLLDGAPIYTPFHMAGLVESFDPLALGGASLFLGGAPARFDGGLSYILDLKTRSPRRDRLHGTAAADLMTGRLLLEGPLTPSIGFLLGSRVIHDLGTPLLGQGPSPYGYGDLLGRVEWEGEGRQGAFVTGFWNQESVVLDLLSENALSTQGEGITDFLGGPAPGDGARWGNRAVSAGYWGSKGSTTVEIGGALSRYDAELPVGDSIPLLADGRSGRARLTADISMPWKDGSLRFGASVERETSRYSAIALDSTRAPIPTRMELAGVSGGAYLEGTQTLRPGLSLRGGLRVDRFQTDRTVRLAPRATLTWMLTEDAALTLAAGRYHQFANLTSSAVEENLTPPGTDSLVFAVERFQPSVGSANHFVVSLDQILTPGLRVEVEGFVKNLSGVSGTPERTLNTSGMDLRVAREGARTAGWLGYTLTWYWASGGILAGGTSPFSGRHLLSAGLTTKLTTWTGLRLRASYGDGLPYTSVPVSRDALGAPMEEFDEREEDLGVEQAVNAAHNLSVGPDEGFFRVEAEIFGHWTRTVAGRPMELRPYLRVLNALNRRDALFYHFNPWRSEGPQPLADLPFLPLLGLEWRF